ncbi:MAG TPA: YggS family pyridoxal phosphate-dependent enzyme, partial [Polyangia bacterium]|nr:YggS family pyridoxal phosphate-dependent enzyme [Polyangia bacterium]
RVARAEASAGRPAGSARLVAVSKMVEAADILAALTAGQRVFGESYGQEFRDKSVEVEAAAQAAGLPRPLWHFIGPLQTNKVKYVAGRVALIHSIEAGDVLAEIERRVAALEPTTSQDCLIQVNVAGEAQKHGVTAAALPTLLASFAQLDHLRCTGLMVMPPYSDDPEESRPFFAALRRLRDEQAAVSRVHVKLAELSMGMSHDLEVAVAEGASLVRVGTAIFGKRQ